MSTSHRPLRIALIAGESSGDVLGAALLAELRRRHPDAEFAGIGGPHLASAGMQCWADAEELAVMGLSEVLRHLPRLLRLRRQIRERILAWQPDVMIGVDAPDFNLGVERWLKQHGVRTIHFISPSVWAWREQRAEKIGESADRVLCLFPMEPAIYARHGVDAVFVGHPLADQMPLEPQVTAARSALNLPPDATVLGMLPGSRGSELRMLAPTFLSAAALLLRENPQLLIAVPLATPAIEHKWEALLAAHPDRKLLQPALRVYTRHAQEVLTAADATVLASGTAALEAMMAKRPMVVAHRISPVTYAIVKMFGMLKTDVYSLPNVLAGRQLIPELMQDRCTPELIAQELRRALASTSDFERNVLPTLTALHQQLRRDAASRAAESVLELTGLTA